MAQTIKLRRGTAAKWTSNNPTLAAGEVGVETDTGKQKVGNGTSAWTALPYSGHPYKTGSSTGTGASQTIAHGLPSKPTYVYAWASSPSDTTITVSEPDATNIYITATNAKAYTWEAGIK